MTSQQSEGGVPQFDLSDRMRKALRERGITVQEMADYLGVGRNTVSTWINGRIPPSLQTTRLWAMRTGVPLVWLQTGEIPQPNGPGEECAIRDSNPEPADLKYSGPGLHLAAPDQLAA